MFRHICIILQSAGIPLKPYLKVNSDLLMLQSDSKNSRVDILEKLKSERAELEHDLTKWAAESAAGKLEVDSLR